MVASNSPETDTDNNLDYFDGHILDIINVLYMIYHFQKLLADMKYSW